MLIIVALCFQILLRTSSPSVQLAFIGCVDKPPMVEVFYMHTIYKIESIVKPDKIYIGSAVNFYNRKRNHINALKSHTHKNRILQCHVNKYGVSDLKFSVLEIVMFKEQLIIREQFYMDKLKPSFNICKIANSSLGVKRTAEYRRKMSLSKKGSKHRPECKAEKSARQKGWKQALGYRHTEDAKRRIQLNHGRKRSVDQYSLSGEFIKRWDYTKQAADSLGVCKVGINACCRGLQSYSRGYIWKYSNK